MTVYSPPQWEAVRERVLVRDGHRCSISRFLGGPCSARLDIHHLVPLAEGGDAYDDDNCLTVCQRHHPQVEALRRAVLAKRQPPRCRHHHPYRVGREECERRNGTTHVAA